MVREECLTPTINVIGNNKNALNSWFHQNFTTCYLNFLEILFKIPFPAVTFTSAVSSTFNHQTIVMKALGWGLLGEHFRRWNNYDKKR
jgi:hypothetical protein